MHRSELSTFDESGLLFAPLERLNLDAGNLGPLEWNGDGGMSTTGMSLLADRNEAVPVPEVLGVDMGVDRCSGEGGMSTKTSSLRLRIPEAVDIFSSLFSRRAADEPETRATGVPDG